MTAPESRLDRIDLADIRAAAVRIADLVVRTPLLRLPIESEPGVPEIWLKLENLQPIGSFKLRGAGNALALADPDDLARGVFTASAGNMAQGVAWVARERAVPCRVVVPDSAPRAKLDAIERLGATTIPVSYDDWWQVLLTGEFPGMEGLFVHPVADPAVIAGNGTIGLEILEDLPDVETVIVPFGGGGLASGIASAVRALHPAARMVACEVETAAPLAASLAAGEPTGIAHVKSFVDGIGGKSLIPEMWPLVSGLIDTSLVVSLDEVAAAVRLLVERARVVAEGAGAAPVAAALSGHADGGSDAAPGEKVVCVVSGGNIDPGKLARILTGQTP